MADEVERPLLRFRHRDPEAQPRSNHPRRSALSPEARVQQIARLEPRFNALEQAIEARRIAIQAQGADARPEHVVVFELARGNVARFLEATQGGPVEWLFDADGEDEDDAPTVADVSAHLYLMFTSADAVSDLLRAWRAWQAGRLPNRMGYWGELFELLRDVRRWGRDDRLREYGMEARWRQLVEERRDALFEIELWYRSSPAARGAASGRVRKAVEAIGGRVEDEIILEGIALHTLLVHVNSGLVDRLLSADVTLVQLDAIHRFRTMTGPAARPDEEEPSLVPLADEPPPHGALLPPLVALLDGLPMQNHAWLAGRLRILDVHGLEPGYLASRRVHGTAMASLIARGDMETREPPSRHELAVVPVLAPDTHGEERAPVRRLWLDVIHRAIVETLHEAKTVCVFNLSLGDSDAALVDGISPLARLLDWLAWEHRVLFIVSAGNCTDDFEVRSLTDPSGDVLRTMWRTRARRRLLPPAEAIQVLTVGAVPDDATRHDDPRRDRECHSLLEGRELPAPYCRNGPGHLGAVKPDVFLPGGRGKYWRGPIKKAPYTILQRNTPPGQRVAYPRDIRGSRYVWGTSNAAALMSRAAEQVIAQVRQLRVGLPLEHALLERNAPLLGRALLIHGASWPDGGGRAQRDLKGEDNVNATHLSDLLGFGVVDVSRVLACTEQRVTLYDVGELRHGEGRQYDVPIPDCLQSTVALRRVIVTVVWLTPIHPRHRRYRHMALKVWTNVEKSPLLVEARGATRRNGRGTVYHRVFDRETGAIDLAGTDRFSVVLRAARQFPQVEASLAVPYAIVVTMETAARVPLYDQIEARVAADLRARVRSGREG